MTTSYLRRTATEALAQAGFTQIEGSNYARKSLGNGIRIQALIITGDERIHLFWETSTGHEVCRAMDVMIDHNAEALLTALASAQVTH